MKALLTQYSSYNLWANERMAALLKTLDSKLPDAAVKSSFPSLRKTVHHIWDAELIWLSRLEGKKLSWPPTAQFNNPGITDFLNTSLNFRDFVAGKDENYFQASTFFHDSKGNPYNMNNTGIIMHVMNHSTYHRGQLVTILRELGITELPATDLIKYIRESA